MRTVSSREVAGAGDRVTEGRDRQDDNDRGPGRRVGRLGARVLAVDIDPQFALTALRRQPCRGSVDCLLLNKQRDKDILKALVGAAGGSRACGS